MKLYETPKIKNIIQLWTRFWDYPEEDCKELREGLGKIEKRIYKYKNSDDPEDVKAYYYALGFSDRKYSQFDCRKVFGEDYELGWNDCHMLLKDLEE